MPRTPHIERHFTASDSVRDVVIGMSDGLTVPFALAAGLSGAVGSSGVVVVAGLAEIAAGAIAMGLGGYLAARSDAEHYTIERARELAETGAKPPCIDPGKVRAVECLPAFRLSPGVTGPASSLPLEGVDDTLARQRPGKLLLALPRGGAVDHWAGDVARGVAGRSVADRRLLDLWREPDPALLRQHHLSLAGAPAARGGYSQAPRSCGDFRTDRRHLYAGVPGDAAGRVGMERPGSRLGSGASRVAAQALLPTSAALVLDRALRGHGVDGGRRRRAAGAEPARQRTDMARDGRGALHPRRSDLRGEMAEPRATGLRLPRGIPHLRAGRQHHALRVHDALRSAWGVVAAASARHSGSVAVTRSSLGRGGVSPPGRGRRSQPPRRALRGAGSLDGPRRCVLRRPRSAPSPAGSPDSKCTRGRISSPSPHFGLDAFLAGRE